ncbi:unnamed protein product [Xylocopa violacea]|uniref:Uncharacterized protein n=1 Tax=Xylocopa violacea TaxID=135666 RepID=A0ABP1P3J9_XYLVO
MSLQAQAQVQRSTRYSPQETIKVKDCIGGYGLRLLESFNGQYRRYENDIPEYLAGERRSNGTESAAIKDNGNCLEYPRAVPSGEDTRVNNGDPEKFKSPLPNKQPFHEERNSGCDPSEQIPCSSSNSNNFMNLLENEEERDVTRMKDGIGENYDDEIETMASSNGESSRKCSISVDTRKDFDLNLFREPFEWKSMAARVTRVSGAARKSDTTRVRSLIPKPRTKGRASNGRGLVNSSSESSGIGSPLSPLSPLRDASSNAKDATEGSMKSSGSGSSGFGSPDSPLSPESQKYAAFYLIEEQLEKLRNCPCEKRQAQVNLSIPEEVETPRVSEAERLVIFYSEGMESLYDFDQYSP